MSDRNSYVANFCVPEELINDRDHEFTASETVDFLH